MTWSGPVTVLLQGRAAGSQFEDDQNQLPLPAYLVADLAVRRAVTARLDLFLTGENLTDERVGQAACITTVANCVIPPAA